MKKEQAIDKGIMQHLKENQAEVLDEAIDYVDNIGQMIALDDAIDAGDYEALIELRIKNDALVVAILEAEY